MHSEELHGKHRSQAALRVLLLSPSHSAIQATSRETGSTSNRASQPVGACHGPSLLSMISAWSFSLHARAMHLPRQIHGGTPLKIEMIALRHVGLRINIYAPGSSLADFGLAMTPCYHLASYAKGDVEAFRQPPLRKLVNPLPGTSEALYGISWKYSYAQSAPTAEFAVGGLTCHPAHSNIRLALQERTSASGQHGAVWEVAKALQDC